MKKVILTALALCAVALLVFVAPASAIGGNSSAQKVPMLSLVSIGLGESLFSKTESFSIHLDKGNIKRTGSIISLYFSSKFVSPINDTLSVNDSIQISRDKIAESFPLGNGTYSLNVPPQHSYLDRVMISGNVSYSYVTLVERVPASYMQVAGLLMNGYRHVAHSPLYNITLDYSNASFILHSPGFVIVNGRLSQVSLAIDSGNHGGGAIMEFSFPVLDGGFSVVFDQVLSSQQQINNYVMSYFQISPGFQSVWLQNLAANSVSIAAGIGLFLALFAALYLYYRRK